VVTCRSCGQENPDGFFLAETGAHDESRRVLREAIEKAREVGDPTTEWRATANHCWWTPNTEADVDVAAVEQLAVKAIEELERVGDDVGLAYAWRARSDVHNLHGQGASWIDAVERAFEHARRTPNRYETWMCLNILGGAMFFGPTPVAEGIGRLQAIRAEIGDDLLLGSASDRAMGGTWPRAAGWRKATPSSSERDRR
jgi:hypothetical protein